MTASTNVPYWVVALRVGCVLSQVIVASGDLPLKLSLTANIKQVRFWQTQNNTSKTNLISSANTDYFVIAI